MFVSIGLQDFLTPLIFSLTDSFQKQSELKHFFSFELGSLSMDILNYLNILGNLKSTIKKLANLLKYEINLNEISRVPVPFWEGTEEFSLLAVLIV